MGPRVVEQDRLVEVQTLHERSVSRQEDEISKAYYLRMKKENRKEIL